MAEVLEQFVTETQVAHLTGLAVQTLRNWRHERRGIPYINVGRAVRYALSDVVAYMEQRRIQPDPE